MKTTQKFLTELEEDSKVMKIEYMLFYETYLLYGGRPIIERADDCLGTIIVEHATEEITKDWFYLLLTNLSFTFGNLKNNEYYSITGIVLDKINKDFSLREDLEHLSFPQTLSLLPNDRKKSPVYTLLEYAMLYDQWIDNRCDLTLKIVSLLCEYKEILQFSHPHFLSIYKDLENFKQEKKVANNLSSGTLSELSFLNRNTSNKNDQYINNNDGDENRQFKIS